MSDEPDSLVLRYLRRMDDRLQRMEDDIREMKQRLTTLEIQGGHMIANEQSHYGAMMARHDQTERRLERIERRLDLTDART